MKAAPFLLIFLFFLTACTTTEPETHPEIEIELTEIDAGVTETYFNVKINNCSSDETVQVIRDGNVISTFGAVNGNRVITDSLLVEKTKYKYTVQILKQDKEYSKGDSIEITTLEPDDRPIEWEIFEFGNFNMSSFREIAITNTDEIWAVGEVYYNDNDTSYGAAHWNGNKWELIRVPRSDYGNPRPDPRPLYLNSIFVNNENVYVTSYASIMKKVDTLWTELAFVMENLDFDGQICATWANDKGEIFCSGSGGALYYIDAANWPNGSNWKKIQTGSKNDFLDIWGYTDPVDQKEKKLFVTGNLNIQEEVKVYKLDDNQKIEETKTGISNYNFSSIWSNKGFPIYIAGDYFAENKNGNYKFTDCEQFILSIRGTGLNDIFFVGLNAYIVHNNGKGNKRIYLGVDNLDFSQVCVTNNLIAIAGRHNSKAVVVIGRR
ncbi:MAG: hypothetical protein GXX85_10190 [Ignavibacteria bacterium]|nr:hypothetical protein [Ignavibacteria bacterium]